MDARTRRKLSMARRVLNFSRAHPADDAGYAGVVERLGAQVAVAEQFDDVRRKATIDESGALVRRSLLRARIRKMLRHVLAVGELVAKDRAELVGVFVGPESQAPNRVFLAASRVLHQAATTHQEALLQYGLAATTLAEMATAIEQYERESIQADQGKDGHVKARGKLRSALADCMDLIKVLDSFNRARFAEQSGELAAWQSARDIFGPVEASTPPTDPIAAAREAAA